ncbi:hypothetical protein [Nocardia goodfellowii]|uniref:Uncharacterized protein n=1 Tax=Nocardia goodfellowii TaxID=882446 RepID=A0ABS4Q906_9NOCA|nr:hypothetical protein [Nocardia goodfellowii]MBP2188166.1 hypothetical protein [Nocardia goodfellowii]
MSAALAIAAHGAAGGAFPDSVEATLVLLVAALTGGAAAAAPAGHRRAGVLAMLAAGQYAGHSVLSGLHSHAHETTATRLPGWWMPAAHVVATLVCAALILLAQRLYLVASGAIRRVLTRPHSLRRTSSSAGWPAPARVSYRFSPNGAIGPRAPPVPA